MPKLIPFWAAFAITFGFMELTPAREIYNLNRSWLFHRPDPPPPVSFEGGAVWATGQFPATTEPTTIRFNPAAARYICLEGRSAHQGDFASIAELELMDETGRPIPRDGWKMVFVSSEEAGTIEAAAGALDGNPQTYWHSAWRTRGAMPPHGLVIDLGGIRTITGFRYVPRQDGNRSGMIKDWAFLAGTTNFAPAAHPSEDDPPAIDAPWEPVDLPHSVRLEPLNASGGRNYQGICRYRKTFRAAPSWKGRKVYLRFEGAMQVAEISLNGMLVHTHFGGYQPFTVDLTDALAYGAENELQVRLDNRDNPEVPPGKPQGGLDFTYFGGLYRNVRLEVMDRLHITDEILANKVAGGGVFVRTPEVSRERAVIVVETDVANERPVPASCAVRLELIDAAGAVVARSETPLSIPPGEARVASDRLAVTRPARWHPHHPYLYTLRASVMDGGRAIDERATRIGLRTFSFRPEGLFINGEKFVASGANRHQDHPYVGYALPDSQHYRDARKLREAGFTSFRSHYPQAPAFMDACDELGILCVVSNPGWQFYGNATWEQRVFQNAREMVRRDRNRPSVVLWEPFPNETHYDEPFARALHDLIHEEYPGPDCHVAGDGEIGRSGAFIEVLWSRDPVPGRPFWAREWGDSVDNWTDQQGRVRVARGWGEVPLLTQALNHALKYDTMLRNAGGGPGMTRLAGAGLWAGIDCYRGYHHQPFLGGPLDLFRLPKFSYYFFQSQRDPVVQMPGIDSGPMVFIANYGTPYSPATVTVFSNCEEVRFHEDGQRVATQKPDAGYVLEHPPFTFKARAAKAEKTTYYMNNEMGANAEYGYHFTPAAYRAEGLIGGKVVATHEVRAPGVMRQIVLDVDRAGRELVADGADWIRVHARICDGRGTLCPLADDVVTFSVEGEGSIIGDASIGANPVRAEAGIATALIRAGPVPGTIRVRASAFGLKAGEASLTTQPAPEPFL